MGLTEEERLKKVLTHLRTIRDKSINLDNNLNSLKSQINNNVIINSDAYKVSELNNVQDDINELTSRLREDLIPNIKNRVNN